MSLCVHMGGGKGVNGNADVFGKFARLLNELNLPHLRPRT